MKSQLNRVTYLSAAVAAVFVITGCAADPVDPPGDAMSANAKSDPPINCLIHGVNGQNKANVVCARQSIAN